MPDAGNGGTGKALLWLWMFFLLASVGIVGSQLIRYCGTIIRQRNTWTLSNATILQVTSVPELRKSSSGHGMPGSFRTYYRLALRLRYRADSQMREGWGYGEALSVRSIVSWQQSLYRSGETIAIRIDPGDTQRISLVGDFSFRSLFEVYRFLTVVVLLLLVIAGSVSAYNSRRGPALAHD